MKTKAEIEAAIAAHEEWRENPATGERAVLNGYKLRYMDLSRTTLSKAILDGADLTHADLSHAVMFGVSLRSAVIEDANLRRAVLTGSAMSFVNMRGADLTTAILADSVLFSADMRCANLRYTDLRRANMACANICGADLRGASLSGANLEGVIANADTAGYWPVLPEGEVVVWKECRGGALVRLRVPADARRSSGTSRSARVEFAHVEEVRGGDGVGYSAGAPFPDLVIAYRVGETVRCHEWEQDRWREGGGIHVYATREEAEAARV